MYQKPPIQCPVCLSKKPKYFKFIRDHKSGDNKFSLYQCADCHVQFWMPFQEPGPNWYLENKLYKKQRTNFKLTKLEGWHKEFLKPFSSLEGIRILDIGCSTGEFLLECKNRGADIWGIDFDKTAIKKAKEVVGLQNVFTLTIKDFVKKIHRPKKFDIITAFEIIEHLDNPFLFLNEIKILLKSSSKLFISTPSRERMFVNFYLWDFPPHHFTRWNEDAIYLVFQKAGLKVLKIYYNSEAIWLSSIFAKYFSFGIKRKLEEDIEDRSSDPSTNINHSRKNKAFYFFLMNLISVPAFLKNLIFIYFPSFILFLFGKLIRRKNGDMLIEASLLDFKK